MVGENHKVGLESNRYKRTDLGVFGRDWSRLALVGPCWPLLASIGNLDLASIDLD